eukprot:1139526-Pelagomonas_calceolata.AAC.3
MQTQHLAARKLNGERLHPHHPSQAAKAPASCKLSAKLPGPRHRPPLEPPGLSERFFRHSTARGCVLGPDGSLNINCFFYEALK